MKQKSENMNAVVSCECVRNLLSSIHGNYGYFKPTNRFYDSCGINCRRWAKLVRGELSITTYSPMIRAYFICVLDCFIRRMPK
ncbi:MAG: hypothetical protein LBP85_09970 [Prevotellaceae bacterium]|nr:hypothetical protein [Prevotellaceae bacterium]